MRLVRGYLVSIALVALVTGLGLPLRGYLADPDVVMLYLLAIAVAATLFGRGPAVLASVGSVLAWDFFFVLPFHTFAIADPHYLLTFAMMFFPATLPLVAVDPVLFEQVLINLLDNAAKHTPAGTSIELVARPSSDAVSLEIADRGPGIAAGDEERLFEKFVRGSRAPANGAGLGLAICRGIMTAHGGTVTAVNRPGGGATFRVSVPSAGPTQPWAIPREMPGAP